MSVIQMNLIAAVDDDWGIGKNNTLPWSIPSEWKYFFNIVTRTQDPTKINAGIYGRKNWDSLKALNMDTFPDIISIIISRTPKDNCTSNVYWVNSLDGAVDLLRTLKDRIETTWVHGGSNIYKLVMDSPYFHRLYLTYIHASFNCDTFFPVQLDETRLVKVHDERVPQGVQKDNGITYEVCVYENVATRL